MTPRRLPPLSFPFALLGALLAHVTMSVLQTAVLDPGAHWIGLGVSAGVGLGTGWVVPVLRRARHGSPLAVAAVLGAGALVGTLMQLVLLLREPPSRTYVLSSSLSTREPLFWILAGAPVGLFPAILLVLVYLLATRRYATGLVRAGSLLQVPAADAWERIMAPFAAAAGLLGALSFGWTDGSPQLAAGAIVVLAAIASLEILLRDRTRARWLRHVFDGTDREHDVVPLTEGAPTVPLAVATAPVEAVVVRTVSDPRYRIAAREPVVHVSRSWSVVTAPLRRRRRALLAAHVGSFVLVAGCAAAASLSLSARAALL